MDDDVNNLVLEHLRHIRTRQDEVFDILVDDRMRLQSLEANVAMLHTDVAHIRATLDKHDDRRVPLQSLRANVTTLLGALFLLFQRQK